MVLKLFVLIIFIGLLWFGWFGFNAGSGLKVDGLAARAFVVTLIAPAAAGAAAEEKSTVALHLASAGDQKIAVIKVIKEALALGLKEAKDMVDGAPILVKDGMKKEDADVLKKKIEEAGGKVEYK
jgi:large subunit ribosomal protein L7/L12